MNRLKKKSSVISINHVEANVPDNSSSFPTIIVPRLLRIQDAARYLSATTWFVETLIREKRIPSLILGKRRVLDVNDLNEWIEEQKKEAA